MAPVDQKERTKRLIKSNAERGLKQVCVWLPEDKVDEVKALAARYRDRHLKDLEK
ncbi:MAG: hypothetical protein V7700_16410 [Halioglobus sp.]